MTIRTRASVRLLQVVQLSYTAQNIDKLVASIRDFDDVFSNGLCVRSNSRLPDGWESLFRRGDPRAFVDMLGAHCVSLSFKECLLRIASPAHYCNSAGFAVWANKALLVFSACMLHGADTFWPNEMEVDRCA